MFAITKHGEKLKIEDPKWGSKDATFSYNNPACIYPDNVRVKPTWVVSIENNEHAAHPYDYSLDVLQEIEYHHEPTQEDILWALATYGKPWSIAFVRKGYVIAYDDD